MVFSPTFSMVTGDSSALVWVLVAETTISSAIVAPATTLILLLEEAEATVSSFVTMPTPEKTRVKGNRMSEGTGML